MIKKQTKPLEALLQALWYNPKIGFKSGAQLWDMFPPQMQKIVSKQEVDEWVKAQETHQKFRRNRVIAYRPIMPHFPQVGEFQIDLADFSLQESVNRQYSWMLVCIDLYSRKVWARAIKTTGATHVSEALESIFDQIEEERPSDADWGLRSVTCDSGLEFSNRLVQGLLKKRKIEYFPVNSTEDKKFRGAGQKLGVVDRFIRTFRGLLNRVWDARKSSVWIDPILSDVLFNYNTRVHSTIKATPSDVFDGLAEPAQRKFVPQPRDDSIKPGTIVRLQKAKSQFDKEGKLFTKNTYTVTRRVGNRFAVRRKGADSDLARLYMRYQLQVVDGDVMQPPPVPQEVKEARVEEKKLPAKRNQQRLLAREGQLEANVLDEGTRRVRRAREVLDL